MTRAIWTGSIAFGLVSIPVRLHPATSPKDVRFHEVDRRSGRRVRRRSVVRDEEPWAEETDDTGPPSSPRAAPPADEPPALPDAPAPERAVARDEIVKAFEVEPGRVVEVEREEIEATRPEPTKVIEVERFVELRQIDPVYFEKSYHLGPADERAYRPYALLRLAMERTGRVAIGRFVLRTKEHLVAVRPTRGILGLETLYFADEVHEPSPSWLAAQDPDVSDRELELSAALIDALAGDWRPEEYEDRDRSRMMEMIAGKAPRDVAPEGDRPAATGPTVADLMETLRASVEAVRSRTETGPKRRGARA